MRHIIVGNGMAGSPRRRRCRLDPRRDHRDFGEPVPFYSRPGLMYYLMGQLKEWDLRLAHDDDFYSRLNVELVLRPRHAPPPGGGRSSSLPSGEGASLRPALLATGSVSRRLHLPGRRPRRPALPCTPSPMAGRSWRAPGGAMQAVVIGGGLLGRGVGRGVAALRPVRDLPGAGAMVLPQGPGRDPGPDRGGAEYAATEWTCYSERDAWRRVSRKRRGFFGRHREWKGISGTGRGPHHRRRAECGTGPGQRPRGRRAACSWTAGCAPVASTSSPPVTARKSQAAGRPLLEQLWYSAGPTGRGRRPRDVRRPPPLRSRTLLQLRHVFRR